MLDQVVLTVGEYEAIRLVDYEGLDHEEAAEKVKVSRATCARMVESAHKKIAEAFTLGKAIRIEGGNFHLERTRYRCQHCGYVWEAKLSNETDQGKGVSLPACQNCRSTDILDLSRQIGWSPAGFGGWGGPGRKGRGGRGCGWRQ